MANADLTRNWAVSAVLLVVGMADGYWAHGPVAIAVQILAIALYALVFYLGTNRIVDASRAVLFGAQTAILSPTIPVLFSAWRTLRMQATITAAHRDAIAVAILLSALWSLVTMLRLRVRRSRGIGTSIALVIIAALLA